ncbi:MAG: tRNA ((37)-N6)-methyltransferase TrmO, partial [Akkermansiaceae bacterium]|nr:tRNA ((37)-N6)-methyltransferase TrmO [Akkermansiaceae bacterium]
LGLSLVRLERVEMRQKMGPVQHQVGLDLADGTPVFDVKPYLPYAEAPQAIGGFAAEAPERLEVVAGTPDFEPLPPRTQRVIRDALSLDPRPPAGRSEPDRIYGVGLCGREVKFTVSDGVCRIVSVCQAADSGLSEVNRRLKA